MRQVGSNKNIKVDQQQFSFEERAYTNLIAHIPGKKPERFIICAHYDALPGTSGADDNGSGTVAVMELARVLQDQKFEYTIDLIFFDAEELGLKGSEHYVRGLKSADRRIEGVINLDMIGYFDDRPFTQKFTAEFNSMFPAVGQIAVADSSRGNFMLSIGDERSKKLSQMFVRAYDSSGIELPLIALIANTAAAETYPVNGSDHASFWKSDIPALSLSDTWFMRNPNYHRKTDQPSTINFTAIARAVDGVAAFLVMYVHPVQ